MRFRNPLMLTLTICAVAGGAAAQGLEIDHKAVGCIVAGKFPKMNACFTPVASLARARVYFRPEGTPSWYYVDMKSDTPCWAGVLPKPSKKLIQKKIEYYVEGQDKSFTSGRTAEYAPIVVASEQECKKDVPVAPISAAGPAAVFPAIPAGFAASSAIGAGTVALGVAGVGAATAGIVVATNGGNTTTTTVGAGPTTTAPAATTTTTTATTTTTPSSNHPPLALLKTIPDPPQGLTALTVTFDFCASTDPDGDPLSFFYDFGDGANASGACSLSHTYTASAFRAAVGSTSYSFHGCVVDPHNASSCRDRTVVVTVPPSPAPSPCSTPLVTLVNPADGNCVDFTAVNASATASDPAGIQNVQFVAARTNGTPDIFAGTCTAGGIVATDDTQTSTGPGPSYLATLTLNPPGPPGSLQPACYEIKAIPTNNCGSSALDFHTILFDPINCCGCFLGTRTNTAAQIGLGSDLGAKGLRLQVIVNGTSAFYPDAGRSYGVVSARSGENRLEATVVDGKGTGGLWQLELRAAGIKPGTLRVVSGETVKVAGSAITFRLRGTPGERIVVTFQRD